MTKKEKLIVSLKGWPSIIATIRELQKGIPDVLDRFHAARRREIERVANHARAGKI